MLTHRIQFLSVAVASLVLFAGKAGAAVSSASVNEQVFAMAEVIEFSGNIPNVISDQHSDSRTVLPPITISVSASAVSDSANANVTITSYSGPIDSLDSTPDLTLVGSTSVTVVNTFNTSGVAEFTYNFSLDADQTYTYSGTAVFTGPSGTISPSSGTLAPGDYTLDSETLSPGTGSFSLTIDAVPEPASLLAGIGLMALACRRRA